MNKIFLGAGAALGIAVITLFWLLMNAQEANGQLQADLGTVAEINAGHQIVIEALKKAARDAAEQAELERRLADQGAADVAIIVADLEADVSTARIRLADALGEVTDEELVCANQFVPGVLLDRLREGAGSDADGDRGSSGDQSSEGAGGAAGSVPDAALADPARSVESHPG